MEITIYSALYKIYNTYVIIISTYYISFPSEKQNQYKAQNTNKKTKSFLYHII